MVEKFDQDRQYIIKDALEHRSNPFRRFEAFRRSTHLRNSSQHEHQRPPCNSCSGFGIPAWHSNLFSRPYVRTHSQSELLHSAQSEFMHVDRESVHQRQAMWPVLLKLLIYLLGLRKRRWTRGRLPGHHLGFIAIAAGCSHTCSASAHEGGIKGKFVTHAPPIREPTNNTV